MKLFSCVNFSKFQFGYKMYLKLTKMCYLIFVECTFLPVIILAPTYNSKLGDLPISGLPGSPDDNCRMQKIVCNQHGETAYLNMQNDIVNGSTSQEAIAPHGGTINKENSSQSDVINVNSYHKTKPLQVETIIGKDNSTVDPEHMCRMCKCQQSSYEDCVTLCCGSANSNKNSSLHINLQQNVKNPTNSTVFPAMKDAHINQDYLENVTSHNINRKTGSKETSEHREDVQESSSKSQLVTDSPESEKPLPSKPATFDSDVSSETSPASNGDSYLFNSWTIIFIFVLTVTLLFSALRYAKQWRRDKLRENYLIEGLYSEARPLCLQDMLD